MKHTLKMFFVLTLLSVQVHAQKASADNKKTSEQDTHEDQGVSEKDHPEDYGYLCGDLLEIYARKPDGLEFVSCEKVEESQTIVRATYRVSGKRSKEIEDFLVNNYGMGRLKWACCAWDNTGKYGSIENQELTKVHPYISAIISMYASGEVASKKSTKVRLQTKREKIEYFTVVELAII